MEKEFWMTVWNEGARLGFHQEKYHDFLIKYYDRLELGLGKKVLVPLCGKTKDLHWLEQKGLEVHGVELSPLAAKAFFIEHGFDYHCRKNPNHTLFCSRNIHIHSGDFFQLNTTDIGRPDAIWDRASLVALPLHLRIKYYQHMESLCHRGTKWLLVALEYPQEKMSGPPFSVSEEEVENYLKPGFHLEHLETNSFYPKGEKFEKAGIGVIKQKVYLATKN